MGGSEVRAALTWADEVAQTLRGSRMSSRGGELTWPEALEQLLARAGDGPYTGRQRQPWEATISDLTYGASQLGPAVRHQLEPRLSELLAALATPPNAGAADRIAKAARLADELLRQADSGQLLPAAWQDLVGSARDGGGFAALDQYRKLLYVLLQRSQRQAEQVCRQLAGVMRDDAVSVQGAQVWLGDLDVIAPLRDIVRSAAGWSAQARADLCERLVVAEPLSAHHVVWHAFRRAATSKRVEEYGPVTLYDSEWLRGNLLNDGPFKSDLPAEATAEDGFFPAEMLPEGKDVVIARVDLGTGARADAPADSRVLVQSLILAATFPEDRHGWELYEGYIHAANGDCRWKVFSLLDEDIDARMPYGPMDITARRLSEMAPCVARHLASGLADLSGVVDAIGWWKASGVQPPHASVLLDVRILETVTGTVCGHGQTWYGYLDAYHKNAWIRRSMTSELFDVVWRARDDHHRWTPQEREGVTAIRDKLLRHRGWESRADIAHVAAELPALAAALPEHALQHRRTAAAAHRISAPESVRAWYTDLENRWTRTLGRLRLVRNALAHGGPVTTAAAASVAPVVHQLAGGALLSSLTALAEGTPVADRHEAQRDRCDAWARDRLSGTTVYKP
ncbi:hypothetical protein PO587_43520 [Streptomyces gilvifuscus]|uniref:Apea-like HEPN domain-containing protein n=1 Tax=Streptomyces gilvifuscus TaxID=1550617 RepID=A0ABT5G9S5_9ACTN|nr:hypothetical protein [Streptomyces gilvifuscus]MDC2961316.1 hypothetical protein [Streptomyces gilvifuscus]